MPAFAVMADVGWPQKAIGPEKGLLGVCPACVTSLINSGALSGREPLHERLGAFEDLGRSGDPRLSVVVPGRGGKPTAGQISDCRYPCHKYRPYSIQRGRTLGRA